MITMTAEELTKHEAAAEQRGYDKCFAAWGESRRQDLEEAKQAGRDEVMASHTCWNCGKLQDRKAGIKP